MPVQRNDSRLRTTEVLDRVLDKGIVIDTDIRIAVAGIVLVTVSAHVKVASFATWRRYTALEDAERRARAGASAPPRIRVRCEHGCTFERRTAALLRADGRLRPQRCVIDRHDRCAVALV